MINMKEISLSCAAIFIAMFIAFLAVRSCTNRPMVYMSSATDECARVESTDPNHDCHNKPDTYDVAWVK